MRASFLLALVPVFACSAPDDNPLDPTRFRLRVEEVSQTGVGRVTVRWTALSHPAVTAWRVYARSEGGQWSAAGETPSGDRLAVALAEGRTWEIAVAAASADAESQHSEPASLLVRKTDRPVVQALRDGPCRARVSWSLPSPPQPWLAGVRISDAAGRLVGDSASLAAGWVLDDRDEARDVEYLGRAFDSEGGEGDPGSSGRTDIATAWAPEMRARRSPASPERVRLAWTAMDGASDYEAFGRAMETEPWLRAGTVAHGSGGDPVELAVVGLGGTDLDAQTSYQWRVTARCPNGRRALPEGAADCYAPAWQRLFPDDAGSGPPAWPPAAAFVQNDGPERRVWVLVRDPVSWRGELHTFSLDWPGVWAHVKSSVDPIPDAPYFVRQIDDVWTMHLLGGFDGMGYVDHVTTIPLRPDGDFAGELALGGVDLRRRGHALVWDPQAQAAWMLGGAPADTPGVSDNSLYLLSFSGTPAASTVLQSHPRRSQAGLTLWDDGTGAALYAFGGGPSSDGEGGDDVLRRLAVRPQRGTTWEALTPNPRPPARHHVGTGMLAGARGLYLLGGQEWDGATSEPARDVWELDVGAGTWAVRTPVGDIPEPGLVATIPYPGDDEAILAFDTAGAWVLWQQADAWDHVDAPPEARDGSAAAVNRADGSILVWGGRTSDDATDTTDDLFELRAGSFPPWRRLTGVNAGPPPASFAATVVDAAGTSLFVLGGADRAGLDRPVAELWRLSLQTRQWDKLTLGGTGPGMSTRLALGLDESQSPPTLWAVTTDMPWGVTLRSVPVQEGGEWATAISTNPVLLRNATDCVATVRACYDWTARRIRAVTGGKRALEARLAAWERPLGTNQTWETGPEQIREIKCLRVLAAACAEPENAVYALVARDETTGTTPEIWRVDYATEPWSWTRIQLPGDAPGALAGGHLLWTGPDDNGLVQLQGVTEGVRSAGVWRLGLQ